MRAQSALEMLKTYGWAFVGLTGVLAALVFMFSPLARPSEECFLLPHLECLPPLYQDSTVVIHVTNLVGEAMEFNLTARGNVECSVENQRIQPQASLDITLSCDGHPTGEFITNITYSFPDVDPSQVFSFRGRFRGSEGMSSGGRPPTSID